jgi:hypothetical protein
VSNFAKSFEKPEGKFWQRSSLVGNFGKLIREYTNFSKITGGE